MKLKIDFVTNSSSAAYIVILPNDFKLLESVDQIKNNDYFQDSLNWDEDVTEESMFNEVNTCFQKLINGESVDREGYGNAAFYTTIEYLQEKNYVFRTIEVGGGDGISVIEPMTLKQVHTYLNRVQKNEIEN